jgi:hypothetical protein
MPTAFAFLATGICAALPLGGCAWLGLGWGALTYPTAAPGDAANVALHEGYAYVARGADGVDVWRLADEPERVARLPAAGASVDDLAVADRLLFALDARAPGSLAVYRLDDPAAPALAQPPVEVDVGPFSGVSAAAGRVVVSGGTSSLSLRAYASGGALGAEVATADLGRGQPDALVAADGRHAFVSVHRSGPHFGVASVALAAAPLRAEPRGLLPLDTWGFTPGGARPASFPLECALAGRLLLVAHAAGLGVVDVSAPDAPRLLSVQGVGVEPVNVDARAGLAALVGSAPRPRLVLLDVASPRQPRILREVPLPEGSRPTGVAIGTAHVVVAAGPAGALFFDLDGESLGAPHGGRPRAEQRPGRAAGSAPGAPRGAQPACAPSTARR